jgi:hypothetical protein
MKWPFQILSKMLLQPFSNLVQLGAGEGYVVSLVSQMCHFRCVARGRGSHNDQLLPKWSQRDLHSLIVFKSHNGWECRVGLSE